MFDDSAAGTADGAVTSGELFVHARPYPAASKASVAAIDREFRHMVGFLLSLRRSLMGQANGGVATVAESWDSSGKLFGFV
jgi:hypothetical protein